MTHPNSNLLRVATSGDYPPFTMTTSSGYHGFDIDLTQLIAAKLGKGVEFRGFSWSEFSALEQICAQPELPSDLAFDVIVSGITVTSERRKFGLFTRPYLRNRAVVLGPKSVPRPVDLTESKLTLGVNHGGYLEGLARRSFPTMNILTTRDNLNLATLIDNGADCIMTDSLEAATILRHGQLDLWAELARHDIAIYMPKVLIQLCAEIDAILHTMLRDGTLVNIAKRHGIIESLLPQL
ncbi:MAG: amino acid ABC transporter substrate-binding protein [Deltaproteobacteria bacterium]|nr:amino acid ABC transporter substrate-binding protein [Deltaproteobacteria bacterium]